MNFLRKFQGIFLLASVHAKEFSYIIMIASYIKFVIYGRPMAFSKANRRLFEFLFEGASGNA